MFNRIAPRYDFMNRFLSLGIDRGWRKKAIRFFERDKPQRLLDVATGTGDMALLAARMLKPQFITGIDISEGMLAIGREKVANANLSTRIELLQGDGETINAAEGAFDGVMVAFGVRNFQNLPKGLTEILRVLEPGAQLTVLEFSTPAIPILCDLYQFYTGRVAPQVAKWFGQNKQAYQYLNESAKAFPDRDAFLAILNKAGYSNTYYKPLTLGICCIYSARKPLS